MDNNILLLQMAMLIVYMGVSTYFDCRWKRIPWWVQAMGAIFACVYLIVRGNVTGIEQLIALMPGIILIFLSFITRENIGYGDGVSVMIIGSILGIRSCVLVICVSLVMISVVGVGLMLLKHASRKTRLPYIPFLFAAQSLVMIGVIW